MQKSNPTDFLHPTHFMEDKTDSPTFYKPLTRFPEDITDTPIYHDPLTRIPDIKTHLPNFYKPPTNLSKLLYGSQSPLSECLQASVTLYDSQVTLGTLQASHKLCRRENGPYKHNSRIVEVKTTLRTFTSLVPMPLPYFITQPWRKSGEGWVTIPRHGPELVDSILT